MVFLCYACNINLYSSFRRNMKNLVCRHISTICPRSVEMVLYLYLSSFRYGDVELVVYWGCLFRIGQVETRQYCSSIVKELVR